MSLFYAIRYFQIVAVVPPLFLAGFLVTIAAAMIRLTTDASAVVEALTPLLLLQLFAASSGFEGPARRGYYDLLLTSGVPRWQIGVAHCAASITPGLVSWMCVALLEVAASHGSSFASVSAGSVLAFVGASLLAWAATISLSRAAAAVGWLLIVTIPAVGRVASPLELLGAPAPRVGIAMLTAVAAIGAQVAWAFARIARAPVPLEASQ
jgi:hypothetical protein